MCISVIIPTYKPDEYIFECLDSLCCQTLLYNLFEVIIVLNGCKDPYELEITQYIQKKMKDMNVCLKYIPEAGVSYARNIGLSMAKGEYICFLDDDDYVSPNFLKSLLIKTVQPSVLIVSNELIFSEDKKDEFDSDYITKAYLNAHSNSIFACRSFLSSSCAKLIHRNIIKQRLFDTRLANSEDSLFMFTVSDGITGIERSTPDAIYYRRIRKLSASRKYKPFRQRLMLALLLIYKFSCVYFRSPFKYSFLLYLSRIAAVIYNNIFRTSTK